MFHWLMVRARRGRVKKGVVRVEAELEGLNDVDRASVLVAAAEIGISLGRGSRRGQWTGHLENPASNPPRQALALYRELEHMLGDHLKSSAAEIRRKRASYGDDVAAVYSRDVQIETLALHLLMARLAPAFEPRHREKLHDISRLLARGVPVLAPAIQRQKKRHALGGRERNVAHYDRLESSARVYAGNV
jgi:hypothetical protein